MLLLIQTVLSVCIALFREYEIGQISAPKSLQSDKRRMDITRERNWEKGSKGSKMFS